MILELVNATRQGEWAQVRQLLLKHWLTQAPKVFEINPDMPWDNSPANEKMMGKLLKGWILKTFEFRCSGANTVCTTGQCIHHGCPKLGELFRRDECHRWSGSGERRSDLWTRFQERRTHVHMSGLCNRRNMCDVFEVLRGVYPQGPQISGNSMFYMSS